MELSTTVRLPMAADRGKPAAARCPLWQNPDHRKAAICSSCHHSPGCVCVCVCAEAADSAQDRSLTLASAPRKRRP